MLIHIEVQGTPERDFARHMFIYYYRIFDRYERPIMGVAILADEQAEWRPERFTQEIWGCMVEMRYPVIKLLDWRARDAELAASMNPFAVVVRAHLAAQETREAVEARGQAKIGLVRGLYERGYGREQILELFRLIDWLLALPAEQEEDVWRTIVAIEEERRMPYITSVERIGRAKGIQDGQRAMLRRVAYARFGELSEALEQRIATADEEALNRLADRITVATAPDDLLS